MNRKKEDRLKIHVSADESETDPEEEETPEQRGEYLLHMSIVTQSRFDSPDFYVPFFSHGKSIYKIFRFQLITTACR